MIAERLRDFQHDALGFQVGLVRIGVGHLEFADDAADRIILRPGILIGRVFLVVIDIEQMIGDEAGMKREAQEAALVLIVRFRMAVFDVEKFLRVAAVGIFFEDENFSGLIDEEHPARTVRRFAHPDGAFVRQLGKDRLELDGRQRLRAGGRGKKSGGGGGEREKQFFHGRKQWRTAAVW